MRRIAFGLGLLLLALPAVLCAQSAPTPAVGSRIRLSVDAGGAPATVEHRVGRLLSLSDRLVVVDMGEGTQRSFPTASVRGLEVSAGRRSHAGRGALYGGLLLGSVTAIGSYFDEAGCKEDPNGIDGGPFGGCGSPVGFAIAGFIVGGGVGAGLGVGVGVGGADGVGCGAGRLGRAGAGPSSPVRLGSAETPEAETTPLP
jgi:hypothetical protein